MELTNKNENSFDPTPKLKSSPISINFFPFNQYDSNCFNCGDEYIYISLYDQKYCKKCLSHYVNTLISSTCIYSFVSTKIIKYQIN